MANSPNDQSPGLDLRCPECRASLKKRRARKVDDCEMVCGGCGRTFDVCDLETVEELKKQT